MIERNDDYIARTIDAIGEKLKDDSEQHSLGLLCGEAGALLYLYYYAHYRCKDAKIIVEKRKDRLIERIGQSDSLDESYAEGIIGIILFFIHLQYKDFLSGIDYLSKELDDAIFLSTQRAILGDNLELFYGASGGLYLYLYDYIYNKTESSYRRLCQLSDLLCKSMAQRTIQKPFDTGLAHGLASLLVILSKLFKLKIHRQANGSSLRILLKEYDMLLSATKDGILFPKTVLPDGERIYWNRLGWCNGDLSCLIALAQCHNNLNSKKELNKIIESLKNIASIEDALSYHVHDDALCHGSAGIHLIFHWLNLHFPCKEFQKAERFWLCRICNHVDFEDSCLGIRKQYIDEHGILITSQETSLLEGLSGVGLTLLSYLSGDYNWSNLFLLM